MFTLPQIKLVLLYVIDEWCNDNIINVWEPICPSLLNQFWYFWCLQTPDTSHKDQMPPTPRSHLGGRCFMERSRAGPRHRNPRQSRNSSSCSSSSPASSWRAAGPDAAGPPLPPQPPNPSLKKEYNYSHRNYLNTANLANQHKMMDIEQSAPLTAAHCGATARPLRLNKHSTYTPWRVVRTFSIDITTCIPRAASQTLWTVTEALLARGRTCTNTYIIIPSFIASTSSPLLSSKLFQSI